MKEWIPPTTPENKEDTQPEYQYLTLDKGYAMLENAKTAKFGSGDAGIKIDYRYGLWVGNQIYSQSKFRVSATGTVQRIILENVATLPTTGVVGELAVSSGTLYICTQASPIVWSVVGLQN